MKDKVFVGASLVASLVASLCCILPISFAIAGIGVVGASAFFAAWRPYLLALTLALLGIGFYLVYRKPGEACEPGSACAMPSVNKKGRIGLWIATAFVIVFAAFPYYSVPVAELVLGASSAAQSASAASPEIARVTFAVEAMYCPSCAATIENKLKAVPGVGKVRVSYEQKQAEVEFDQKQTSVEQLEKVIIDAGYKGRRL